MLSHGTEWAHTSLVFTVEGLSPGGREGISQRRVRSESGAPKLPATAHHARCGRGLVGSARSSGEGGWLWQTVRYWSENSLSLSLSAKSLVDVKGLAASKKQKTVSWDGL